MSHLGAGELLSTNTKDELRRRGSMTKVVDNVFSKFASRIRKDGPLGMVPRWWRW